MTATAIWRHEGKSMQFIGSRHVLEGSHARDDLFQVLNGNLPAIHERSEGPQGRSQWIISLSRMRAIDYLAQRPRISKNRTAHSDPLQ